MNELKSMKLDNYNSEKTVAMKTLGRIGSYGKISILVSFNPSSKCIETHKSSTYSDQQQPMRLALKQKM